MITLLTGWHVQLLSAIFLEKPADFLSLFSSLSWIFDRGFLHKSLAAMGRNDRSKLRYFLNLAKRIGY